MKKHLSYISVIIITLLLMSVLFVSFYHMWEKKGESKKVTTISKKHTKNYTNETYVLEKNEEKMSKQFQN